MRDPRCEHRRPWPWAVGLLLTGASAWAAGPRSAGAAPLVAPGPDPQPIYDGDLVPECAWPSVVALYSNTSERCSGSYIGGRVILTAAHCVPLGLQVTPSEPCQTDDDCPAVDAFGDPLTLTCAADGDGDCRDPDPTKSNGIAEARFGEQYLTPLSDGHIRRSVGIAYCRRRNDEAANAVKGSSNDIAYCILRERPNVQPIPIAMHCEVDQFLTAGTSVTAVGFGRTDPDVEASGGIKRMATSVLPDNVLSPSVTFTVGLNWSPGAPQKGDSGGPLLTALPDGTWRMIGVASTAFVEYVSPWPHMGWLLSDPNVVQTEILPCHTPGGSWAPSAGCGGFPVSPGSASGSWGRGPMACFDPEVGGPSQTCGPPGGADSGGLDETGAPTMGVVDDEPEPLGSWSDRETAGCGCQTDPRRRDWRPFGLLVVLATVRAHRRRRRGHRGGGIGTAVRVGLLLGAVSLTGCPKDPPAPVGGGTEGDTSPDSGLPPEPPPIDPNNPEYRGTLAGIDPDPAIDYADIAVGNVSAPASSAACCQDYVIASPSSSIVRVLFSADLPGLTFLADVPDELVDVGGSGVDDVQLADLDGDDRNDLIALRTDGSVAVVRGIAGPPGGPFFDAASLSVVPAGSASGALMVTDLDCDGDLDLAATAPAANGVVPLFGNGNGTFVASSPIPAGSAPQDLAVGDVDGDDDPDLAVANDDGGFSIVINNCGGSFAPPDGYQITLGMSPGMPIAMGRLCPGHPNDMAVAVGAFELVYLTCGDGTGDFANVIEPHGQQFAAPYDYSWDPSGGFGSVPLINDLFVWDAGPALYALRVQAGGSDNMEIVWMPPAQNNIDSGEGRTIMPLQGGGQFLELTLHSLRRGGETWNRGAFVGHPGIGVTK